MVETEEELANREIDDLYRQALFLHGGDEARAEDLLLEALAGAPSSSGFDGGEEESRRWLQRTLVKRFLKETKGSDEEQPPDPEIPGWRGPFDDLRIEADGGGQGAPIALVRAARGIPARARAAVWLVLFSRWTFDDAAGAMEIELEELEDLLCYRHTLLAELLRRARRDRTGELAG